MAAAMLASSFTSSVSVRRPACYKLARLSGLRAVAYTVWPRW
jgi:hypothetical protein